MRSTSLKIVSPRKQFPVAAVLALAAGLTLPSTVLAHNPAVECNAATLRGVYINQGSGYNIVSGKSQPVAIIGKNVFDGRGNVTSPAVSLSANGVIVQPPQGNPGNYTVDADCTGTLTFTGGTTFDLVIAPSGELIYMLQTNPGSVLGITAQRVSRAVD